MAGNYLALPTGFTGTRKGMTVAQMQAVHSRLVAIVTAPGLFRPRIEAHHGDCLGADAEFHVIAAVLGARHVLHPPDRDSSRAWCKPGHDGEIRAPKAYLPRDWDIAEETAELIAAPDSMLPRRSGTWTTIGYAVTLLRPVRVILPDGSVRAGNSFGLAPAVRPS